MEHCPICKEHMMKVYFTAKYGSYWECPKCQHKEEA